jgi:methionine-rich copper-binding protein CopC
MNLSRRKITLALLALLGAGTSPARSHAAMIRSSPPANGTVKTAPQQVAIYFSERVRAASDAMSVTDQSGARLDRADAKPDGNGRVVRVSLEPLEAGTYRVNWRVQSSDKHTVQGSFTFRVSQ